MNVVLPLGRLTCSLNEDGYDKPLQLTLVLGRPVLFWLLDSLRLGADDVVWLVVSAKDEATYLIYSAASAEYRTLREDGRLRLIPLYYRTSGVAETLQIALNYMQEGDLVRPTLCLNSDMIFNSTLRQITAALSPKASVCFLTRVPSIQHVKDSGANWSYCNVSTHKFDVKDVWRQGTAPKNTEAVFELCELAVSTPRRAGGVVMMGAYAFGTGLLLRARLAFLLGNSAPSSTPLGFSDLVLTEARPAGILMSGQCCVPLKNAAYLRAFVENASKQHLPVHVKGTRYIFQMYGGLLNDRDEPRQNVVDVVRQLKRLGHHIIVSSSRGRSAIAVRTLMSQLEQYCICYDEIHLNDDDKDYTVNVGSNVLNIRSDLHKALGIPGADPHDDVVQPRHFNKVEISDGQVVKTSDTSSLSGEVYYYQRIPLSLQSLFPRLLSHEEIGGKISLSITRVIGVTYSHLIVNRCIDKDRLMLLLEAMTRLHNHGNHEADRTSINHYSNYADKVEGRLMSHREIYVKISKRQSSMPMIQSILQALRQYEAMQRADVRAYIHGDPVFSNCILSRDNSVSFIDMNGRQGDILTTSGDSAYDFAKILQSLYGYDYILLDVPITRPEEFHLRQLRESLRVYVETNYNRIIWRDIKLITASLFVSLIPLHDNLKHQIEFWKLGARVFESWKNHDVKYKF